MTTTTGSRRFLHNRVCLAENDGVCAVCVCSSPKEPQLCIRVSDVSRTPSISPVSSAGFICRICHDGDSKENLVAPCHCTGTMRMVHRTCLEKWLSSSNSDACEICKYKFSVCRQPKSFYEWIQQPSNPDDYRNVMGDCLCFMVLTPLAMISSYLCFVGAKHYSAWSTRWEASGLVCLSVLLLAIYVTWCCVTVRYHLRVLEAWKSTNQNVYLLLVRQVSAAEVQAQRSLPSEQLSPLSGPPRNSYSDGANSSRSLAVPVWAPFSSRHSGSYDVEMVPMSTPKSGMSISKSDSRVVEGQAEECEGNGDEEESQQSVPLFTSLEVEDALRGTDV